MNLRHSAALALVVPFGACSTGERISSVREGMSRSEVVGVLGDPDGVIAVAPDELRRLLPLVRAQGEKEDRFRAAIKSQARKEGRVDAILRSKGCPI